LTDAMAVSQRLQIAMQDAMLHYIRLAFARQARKGGPVKRAGDQTVSGGQPAVRHLQVQGRRVQRLRVRLHEPRQASAPRRRGSPMLGRHSAEVLANWLGLSWRQIDGCAADKVITQRP
jgi:crotonobetainyl-CoA:carnitine CoA-transferase CaiB-like acyl-CoA transferase